MWTTKSSVWSAIGLWSSGALIFTWLDGFNAFQIVALGWFMASLILLIATLIRGVKFRDLISNPMATLVGTLAYFLYSCLYVVALRHAPIVEANLLNYLWPIMIILFSTLFSLRWPGLLATAGAVAGLIGTIVILFGDRPLTGEPPANVEALGHQLGYLAGLGCAVIWGAYTAAQRKFFSNVPFMAMVPCTFIASILAFGLHLSTEDFAVPALSQWAILFLYASFPMALAYLCWDHASKKTEQSEQLAAPAYVIPLLSTFLLIAFADGSCEPKVLIGGGLIILGAFLADWTPKPVRPATASNTDSP